MATQVDQGASGVPGVNGSTGLDQVLQGDAVALVLAAADSAHDPFGDCALEPVRGPERHHDVTRFEGGRIAEGRGLQARAGHMQDRQVSALVAADDCRVEMVAVAGQDRDGAGTADDVRIGHDVALVIENDTRAEAAVGLNLNDRGLNLGRDLVQLALKLAQRPAASRHAAGGGHRARSCPRCPRNAGQAHRARRQQWDRQQHRRPDRLLHDVKTSPIR